MDIHGRDFLDLQMSEDRVQQVLQAARTGQEESSVEQTIVALKRFLLVVHRLAAWLAARRHDTCSLLLCRRLATATMHQAEVPPCPHNAKHHLICAMPIDVHEDVDL